MGIINKTVKRRVNVHAEWRDVRTGKIIHEEWIKNMIVAGGLNSLAKAWAGDATDLPSHMAIGTGTTAITLGDTTLESEVSPRIALGTNTSSGATYRASATWGSGDANGNTIANAGLFDAASSGVLLAAAVLDTTVVKDATKSLTITWYATNENA